MTSRLKLSKSGAITAIVVGDLILLVLGWFMLVGPERARAQSTARAADATQVQVEQARMPVKTTPTTQPKQPEIRTAYLYKLSKAMPMTTDMPNLLLELNEVVRESGAQLTSISPSLPDPTGTSTISLSVTGDFYSLTDLLYRLRTLVAVHDGGLDVSGRLFSVQSVSLAPAGPPRELTSSIKVDAYTFGSSTASTTPAPVPTPTDTSGTTTDTTSSGA